MAHPEKQRNRKWNRRLLGCAWKNAFVNDRQQTQQEGIDDSSYRNCLISAMMGDAPYEKTEEEKCKNEGKYEREPSHNDLADGLYEVNFFRVRNQTLALTSV
jgi:hypothetical protein